MDLTFKTQKGKFNYRVGAIIIKDGKLLMVRNTGSDYYYSVGGRVKFDEDSENAVIRETAEETGAKMSVNRLIAIHENFFTEKEHYHEISFYYIMNVPENFVPLCKSHTDLGESESLEWLEIEKLDSYKHYPHFLKELILNPTNQVQHIVTNQEKK